MAEFICFCKVPRAEPHDTCYPAGKPIKVPELSSLRKLASVDFPMPKRRTVASITINGATLTEEQAKVVESCVKTIHDDIRDFRPKSMSALDVAHVMRLLGDVLLLMRKP